MTPVVEALIAWYGQCGRALPWRGPQVGPWGVWVSEVMLQQTRVETVGPYWGRFMERFPTPAALAAADEQEVLSHWQGLGYYRRARLLHRAARAVVAEHGGRVPDAPAAFQALPGVGRYTAGAVMSIAFGLPEPILDGNVLRVLARVYRVEGDPRSASNQRRLWGLASDLARVAGGAAGDLNQALMDLGATVCTPPPGRPHCLACPLHGACAARRANMQEALPGPTRRPAVRPIRAACAALRDRAGRTLLARRPGEGLLAGMWELPGVDLAGPRAARAAALAAGLQERVGVAVGADALVFAGEVLHAFTHRRLALAVFAARRWAGEAAAAAHYPEVRWVDPDAPGVPLPALTRKALAVARSAP